MDIEYETNLGDYFELPNPRLRSYFNRVVAGQPEVYRTPFYGKKDVTELLNEWMPHLQSLENKWPTLLEFEKDLAKKVGPMSVMKPLEERMSDIESYYDCVAKQSKPIPECATDAVIQEFGSVSGLRLRSQDRTVKLMKKSTSSGNPYNRKRRDVVNNTVPCTIDREGQLLPPGVRWKSCAILGWRGQEGGPNPEDVKQRVVWMFPFAVNVAELQVYQPLIEACQRFNLVPAWVSMEAVDQEITNLFDTKDPDDLIVCTDFSKYDQHFNADMQDGALRILKALLTPSADSAAWLEEVFPVKYHIPLMFNYGQLSHGEHGMGSGSGGTNADETLTHRALQHEAAISAGSKLNPHSMCLGDDGILTYPGIDVEHVTKTYSSHGQDMNIDKQYASTDDCTYLRRWHHKDYRQNGVCVGVYSTARALGRLCMQERYYDPKIWNAKMVALRQLSILQNVEYHPMREEFVDFCMKGDKFRLGLDIPGFFENIDAIAQEANDHMPDFLGYTKSMQESAKRRLSDWWIVKYLKSKA